MHSLILYQFPHQNGTSVTTDELTVIHHSPQRPYFNWGSLLCCIFYYCHCLIAKSCPTLCDPWTVTCQALLSMGFPRQEWWSGLSFPLQGSSWPGDRCTSPVFRRHLYQWTTKVYSWLGHALYSERLIYKSQLLSYTTAISKCNLELKIVSFILASQY